MSPYSVLVDSSVWIKYFNSGNTPTLDRLIVEDLACINELILTVLAPVLMEQKEHEIIAGLNAIHSIPLTIDWEIIREYQLLKLEQEINKVGIPDLIILQQVIQHKISLFTFDKHFKLMQSFLEFDLFNS